jgi:transposase
LRVHGADVQDRDGAPAVLKSIRHGFPWLRHVFADGAYGGPKLRGALEKIGDWTVEIIKRSDAAKGLEVLPRRWVVERTFAWLTRCRRLARHYEALAATTLAFIKLAMIRIMLRRLASPSITA